VFGSLIGFLLAAAKVSKKRFCRILAYGYTSVVRCTPPIVLLFLVFYGLPVIVETISGVDINDVSTGFFVMIAFSLLFGASSSETFRSAYESIDKGQMEASLMVGLSETQTFFRILLPQCFYVALPNLSNLVIDLIKQGALAYTIGYVDFMGRASLTIANNYGSHARETYIGVAAVFWLISFIIQQSLRWLEKFLGKGRVNIRTAGTE
jgi:L-cystine transport system permease protein